MRANPHGRRQPRAPLGKPLLPPASRGIGDLFLAALLAAIIVGIIASYNYAMR